ncbi:YHS domain protein [Planctomycetales bacterium ZRK34]|nr:YHS domain protein [Planctomycetales bacterium ZRK34]
MNRYVLPAVLTCLAVIAVSLVKAEPDDGASCPAKVCSACESCAADGPQAPSYVTRLGLAGYSPVSYLDERRAEPGSPRFSADHADVTYFFTSEKQRESFRADPHRYLPAYGGYCAFGCTIDSKFVPDPTQFKIVNGRTHLFLKNDKVDALKLWNQGDQAQLMRKADAYWNQAGH